MERLDENWLTNGWVDFEYKKYLLLAYLKTVKENFNDKKLFPYLSDLVFHYRNLQLVKEQKKIMTENFPKEIKEADFEKMKITYRKLVEDDEVMAEINSIISFAQERLKSGIEEGKEIYDFLEKQIEIHQIGISPLQKNEGYIFITENKNSDYSIFKYIISIFENSVDRYRAVNFQYLGTFRKRLSETYEYIKQSLIKSYRELPNPATFLMVSSLSLPQEETYLPMAKRMLVKHVGNL